MRACRAVKVYYIAKWRLMIVLAMEDTFKVSIHCGVREFIDAVLL